MTNKVTMPDPVAYAIFAENGNIRIWSTEPRDLPDLDSLGPMRQLITTWQAEAYANARVREALEKAAHFCETNWQQFSESDVRMFMHKLPGKVYASAIRALIPREPPCGT